MTDLYSLLTTSVIECLSQVGSTLCGDGEALREGIVVLSCPLEGFTKNVEILQKVPFAELMSSQQPLYATIDALKSRVDLGEPCFIFVRRPILSNTPKW